VYQLNKSTDKVKYWKCEVKYCTAAIHTDANDQFIKKSGGEHTHLSSPEHVQVRKLRKRVKDRVSQESIAIGRIYDDELTQSQLSQTSLAVAPTAEEASKFNKEQQFNICIFLCRIGFESYSAATHSRFT
jgi:hypothetical protein